MECKILMEVHSLLGELVLVQIGQSFQWVNTDTGYKYSLLSTAEDAKEFLRNLTGGQYYLTKSYDLFFLTHTAN